MKLARFFAFVFAGLGILLLLGSMGFLLLNRDGAIRVLEMPREAAACSDTFAQVLDEGNLTAASMLLYGQPDLGVEGIPETVENGLVWEAFLDSMAFEFTGECYVTQSGFFRDGVITTLDLASVAEKLPERVQALMDRRIAAAEELSDIYDEQNQFREELTAEILQEALQQALDQDAGTVTREVTLKLVDRDGHWWVVPDTALLQAISGVA